LTILVKINVILDKYPHDFGVGFGEKGKKFQRKKVSDGTYRAK
jgi:hypothetical protein